MQTSSKIAQNKKEKEAFNMMGKGRERRSRSIMEIQPAHMIKEPISQEEKKTVTEISIKDFKIIETIGKGSFGTVYLA